MIYFGTGDLLYFVKPNNKYDFHEQNYILRSVPREIMNHVSFVFYKDFDTGFFRFVKFRADGKPLGKFYHDFNHVLEEIVGYMGGNIMSLRRMKEFRNYGCEYTHKIVNEIREEYMK